MTVVGGYVAIQIAVLMILFVGVVGGAIWVAVTDDEQYEDVEFLPYEDDEGGDS